jgi:hypothetical protein
MQPMKPMMPTAAGTPAASTRAKMVDSKPDHKATKAAKKKMPQKDGLAKHAAAISSRFR